MYDASKETDKDFLRAALKRVQEQNILMAKKIALLEKQQIKDEEICKKLSEELFLLRKSIYGSKKEEREKARERARLRREREKKRKHENRPHNRSENDPPPEPDEKSPDLSLEEETEEHVLDDENKCPKCGGEEGFARINSHEESGEIEVVERRYIFKRHRRQKYHCKCCKSIVTAPGGRNRFREGSFPSRWRRRWRWRSTSITSRSTVKRSGWQGRGWQWGPAPFSGSRNTSTTLFSP